VLEEMVHVVRREVLSRRRRWLVVLVSLALALLFGAACAPRAAAAVSAQQIDSFLMAHGSPLAGEGAVFCAAGRQYGVDPAFLIAISGAESNFGQLLYTVGAQTATYNALNWFYGPSRITSTFTGWSQAIETVAQGLSGPLYYGAGRCAVADIAPVYCPQGTQDWIANVTTFLLQLGGNPYDTRWSSSGEASSGERQADLVLQRPVRFWPSTPKVGQALRIRLLLLNVGGEAGNWSGVILRLEGPGALSLTYSADRPFSVPGGGEYAFVGSLHLRPAGLWRGWVDVETSEGTALSEGQPAFRVTLRGGQ
jgi:hypothetical protein